MKLKPLHDKVLVKRTDEEQTTPGGIVLPGSATEKPSQGEVVAVGPGKRQDNGDVAPMGVKVGDLVIFGQYGGNEVKISVGENCLIGANSGLGIPLGNNCIIEAGLYITGGSKVEVFDQDMQSKGIIKAEKLSNKNNILFIRNSLSGAIEARVNTKSIELNDSLHLNQ